MWLPISLGAGAWLALILLARWLGRVPIRRGDIDAAILVRTIQVYARLVHRLRVEGAENIPRPAPGHPPGPLIVVSNHSAGVDPILIQAALPFEPRWMMAEDMRDPHLDDLWAFARIIFVDRTRPDPRSLRTAMRHLHHAGVLGVFPEGFIERPARHLLPFRPGVGLLIKRARAGVLPVVVDGTPQAPTAMGSYFRPSRARVRFLPMVRYEGTDLDPEQIAADLRRRFAEATGWPDAPRAPIVTSTRRIMLDVDAQYVDEEGNRVSDADARAIAAESPTAPAVL